MAKKKLNIKSAIKRPGALTRKAKNKGMSVPEFTKNVKSNPNKYSTLTQQQANFANLLASFKKKASGGFGNPEAVAAGLGAAGSIASGLSPKQGSAGNLLGDAASGAATGAMFGPWGAVIGAGVGLGKGLIEANKEKKEKEKFDKEKSKFDFQNAQNQQALFAQNFTTQGTDTGFNRGAGFGNSYLGPQQMMRTGGKRRKYGNGGPEDEAPMTVDTSQSANPEVQNLFQGTVLTTDKNAEGAQPMGFDPNSQTFMPSVTFPEFDAAVEEIPRDAQGERMFTSNQQKDNFYAFQNMGASGLADMRAMRQGVKGATSEAAQFMAAPANMDNVQYGLMGAGLVPGVGIVPDLVNTGISLGRAGYNKAIGDQEAVNKHMVSAGINAFAAVPGIGLGAPGLKAAQVIAPGATRAIQATANLGPKMHGVFHGAEYAMQGMHGLKSGNHFINEAQRLGQTQMKTGGKKLPGGEEVNLPNGAKKYLGNKHGQSGRGSKSGILVDPKTEVTHNETKDKIVDNQGKAMEYFFSPEMKVGGKSFAKRHEEILRSGGTRANIQKELQRLAKLQEDHANKYHGEKHRDGKQILANGGVKKYNIGGPKKDFDMSTLQKEQATALPTVPPGQSLNTSGLYGNLTQEQVQETMDNNPWYDWSDFDASNPDSVLEFQRAFNALSPTIKLDPDGLFGQQTQKAKIPVAKADAIQDQNPTPEQKVAEETVEEAKELAEDTSDPSTLIQEEQKTNVPQLDPPKLRDVPPLAYLGMAAQAVGPIAALLKDSPKPREVSANLQGKKRLNRFDFDSERAQNIGNTVAFNRAIEGSGAGPAGIASMMAANSKAAQNANSIATKEAQVNKSQSDAETALNQRIAQSNISNQYDADVRNTAAKNERDMYEYEKDMGAVDALGNLAASGARDVLAYKRDERVAGANQIAGEYTRQRYFEKLNSSPKYRKLTKGMTEQEKRRVAAAMWDNSQTLEELDQSVIDYYNNLSKKEKEEKEKKKTGGKYTSRYGKIKKRK